VAKTQTPQVIDRSAARPMQATLSYGTGLEAVLCMMVLNGDPPFSNFERGPDLARAVTEGLPRSVARASAKLRTPHGDPWSALFARLAADAERPHDIGTVRDRLERTAPAELKLTMLGFGRSVGQRDASIYRAVAAGDRSAVAALRKISAGEGRLEEVEPLLRLSATDLRTLVIDALGDLPNELYAGPGAAELLERDAVAASEQLFDSRIFEIVVERLTRGLSFKPEPGIIGVVLVPSLVHRPWTLVLDHGHRKVFCYPCRLDSELAAPDLGLIAIYRALGDGTRLRILRRLATGPASVAQMGEQLGLAKSTVHEHLLSLRSAGLVRLPSSGGFELVPELPDLNWMLKEFLGLEMRGQCETCGTKLEPGGVAFICSYECTFCQSCATVHRNVCPNCSGELVPRPRRLKTAAGRSAPAHRGEHLRRRHQVHGVASPSRTRARRDA
jgi:biotin operon repressor